MKWMRTWLWCSVVAAYSAKADPQTLLYKPILEAQVESEQFRSFAIRINQHIQVPANRDAYDVRMARMGYQGVLPPFDVVTTSLEGKSTRHLVTRFLLEKRADQSQKMKFRFVTTEPNTADESDYVLELEWRLPGEVTASLARVSTTVQNTIEQATASRALTPALATMYEAWGHRSVGVLTANRVPIPVKILSVSPFLTDLNHFRANGPLSWITADPTAPVVSGMNRITSDQYQSVREFFLRTEGLRKIPRKTFQALPIDVQTRLDTFSFTQMRSHLNDSRWELDLGNSIPGSYQFTLTSPDEFAGGISYNDGIDRSLERLLVEGEEYFLLRTDLSEAFMRHGRTDDELLSDHYQWVHHSWRRHEPSRFSLYDRCGNPLSPDCIHAICRKAQ